VPEPRGTLRVAGLSGYGAANGKLNPVIKTRKGEREYLNKALAKDMMRKLN
jgi:hypothetical protein